MSLTPQQIDQVRRRIATTQQRTAQRQQKPSPARRAAAGLDLSKWQASFDPRRALRPVDFVILKASQYQTDRKFREHYQSARKGGVPIVGAYHYLAHDVPVQKQVETFLNSIAGTNLDFLAVDVEPEQNVVNADFIQKSREFIHQVRSRTKKPVLLYTNISILDQWYNQPQDKDIPLWVSWPEERAAKPPVNRDWAIWQQSFAAPAREFGVTGATAVDYNVFAGTVDDMRRWLQDVQRYQYKYDLVTPAPFIPVGVTAESVPVESYKISSWGSVGDPVQALYTTRKASVLPVSSAFPLLSSASASSPSMMIEKLSAPAVPPSIQQQQQQQQGQRQEGRRVGGSSLSASAEQKRQVETAVQRRLASAGQTAGAGGGKAAADTRNSIEKLFNADMASIMFYVFGILLIIVALAMYSFLFSRGVYQAAEAQGITPTTVIKAIT